MIVTAKPWNAKPGCPGTDRRTYTAPGMGTVEAEITHDPTDGPAGRVWFKAWRITGRDRWGGDTRELVAHGSLAATRYAATVAKARVSRTVNALGRREATRYYQAKLARAVERMEAAREALDAVELADYRTLAARQDELAQLTAELDHVKRMMALAA